jgi:hypothetical protein
MIFLANHLIYHTMGLAMALVGLWNGPHTWCHWLCVVPYADAGQRDGPTCWSWCVGRGASNFMGFLLVYIYISDQQMGKISRWCPSPYFNWSNFYGWFPSELPWTSQDLAGYHDETRSRQGLEVCGQWWVIWKLQLEARDAAGCSVTRQSYE